MFFWADNSDYVLLPSQVEFHTATTGRECFQGTIIDDDIFEDLETFMIVMTTEDSAVIIPQSELTLTIEDNNCE